MNARKRTYGKGCAQEWTFGFIFYGGFSDQSCANGGEKLHGFMFAFLVWTSITRSYDRSRLVMFSVWNTMASLTRSQRDSCSTKRLKLHANIEPMIFKKYKQMWDASIDTESYQEPPMQAESLQKGQVPQSHSEQHQL